MSRFSHFYIFFTVYNGINARLNFLKESITGGVLLRKSLNVREETT